MEALIIGVATALCSAMVTDGWTKARSAITGLCKRAHPDPVPCIEQDLEDLRGDVIERGQDAEEEVMSVVKSNVRRLLKAAPQLQGELQLVLDEQLLPLLPQEDQKRVIQVITQTASVSGHGTSTQAGGNIIQVGAP